MNLVFFLEERSARFFLEGFLPRVLPCGVTFRCIAFEGKQDLEKQLQRKIENWLVPSTHFIVMRDQDSGNCLKVKQRLVDICAAAGRPESLVRIACHELESWYLGNLSAVEKALILPGLGKKQGSRKYRQPDQLSNASEELLKLTKGAYQKISGSREIGRVMPVSGNTSCSFNSFVTGVQRICKC